MHRIREEISADEQDPDFDAVFHATADTRRATYNDACERECKNDLSHDQPSEVAFEILGRARQAGRELGVGFFQEHVMKEVAEEKHENENCDDREQEFGNVHKI